MTIVVTCLGHIRTSLGREVVEVEGKTTAVELVEKVRAMAAGDRQPGFTRFNTLLVVNGESAFTAAADDRLLNDGDEVLLVPFSHGG